MISYWINSNDVRNHVYIPKYYDPALLAQERTLRATHDLLRIGDLVDRSILSVSTGDEIGSDSYGTGNIPFVRTSDIANWEIRSAPKQGVSEQIFEQYRASQDVQENDILFVRDGTYLIGENCFVTAADRKLLFQSHILKIRVRRPDILPPQALFLALNTPYVQKQVRSFQFTADIIDTIGQRFYDIILPVPRDKALLASLSSQLQGALLARLKGKCFIKQCPVILEEALRTGSADRLDQFAHANLEDVAPTLAQDTVSLEFGGFEATWIRSNEISNHIYLPKYYDPEIDAELQSLSKECDVISIEQLLDRNQLTLATGDEPGKMAYDTGDIPFVRTSDFANWEIKHNPKQGVSRVIYEMYAPSQDVRPYDIFLVRDGTYLVGSTAIVTPMQSDLIYCGGLYKVRSLSPDYLDPYLLLGLLNSYIVKRQIRSKQFTRDVIDTIGQRLKEVCLPIPKSAVLRKRIASIIKEVVETRLSGRDSIRRLSDSLITANI